MLFSQNKEVTNDRSKNERKKARKTISNKIFLMSNPK